MCDTGCRLGNYTLNGVRQFAISGDRLKLDETELQYLKVHTLSNRFEADLIADALRREGIPFMVRSFEETPYAGLFIPQRGWGRVMVPGEMADLAREIIASLSEVERSGELPTSGDFEVEPRLWRALEEADPEEVSARAIVQFDREKGAYIIPLLNTAVLCYPETKKTELPGRFADLSNDPVLTLVILHYLLDAQNKPLANKWVSEKDLPGGRLFFTASHTLPMEPLAEAFDPAPDLLGSVARSIGGEEARSEGLSFRFRVLPRIPIQTIFWLRDEEFEPSFHVLFDETIVAHLESLDLIWALVQIFARILLDFAALTPDGPGNG
jgi:hypothetical protein